LTANVRVVINLVGNGQGPDRSYHPVAALALWLATQPRPSAAI